MKFREDKYGNKLSVLGFGAMRLPRRGAGIDYAKSERLIAGAVASGVNYFDTAYVYPGSEEMLGRIIEANKLRDFLYIATKLPPQKVSTLADAERILCEQLSRLRTKRIDYYLLHNMSSLAMWERLLSLGITDWLEEKQAEGKIGQIGFSFHGARDEFMKLLDAYNWDFCQIQYNYMNEHYQAGVEGLKAATAKGLPVIIMEPLLGGKLVSGLPPKAVEAFATVNQNRTAAEWGLRWLWDQPEVTVVLSGMNEPWQLADNAAASDTADPGCLSDEERAVYAPVVETFRESYKVPCTGCAYCMPCPNGVNIPGCFAAYNTSYALGFISGMQQYVTGTGADKAEQNFLASKCIKCGKCERQCPQHIAIADELTKVVKRCEPWWFKTVLRLIRRLT